MSPTPRFGLTLAVYATSSDLAWIAFENPFLPYDWGLVSTKDRKNERALQAVDRLIDRLHPEALVMEAFERRNSKRTTRIGRLGRALTCLATDRGTEVAIYERDKVTACFSSVGAKTREEIAAAVVRHIDAFRYRLPKRRRAWEGERRDMALFSATALALTHYQLSAARLLDNLRDAA